MGERKYTERVISKLRGGSFKITPQRLAVVSCLDGNTSHPSVEDIHREVAKSFPTISVATIYNTLDTLESINEVQPLCLDPSRKHYDPVTEPHHHVYCEKCGDVKDMFADFSDCLVLPPEMEQHYSLISASAVFRTLCGKCTDKLQ